MQSFASPTHTNPPPHKNHAPQIKHHKFMPHPHKKGATIAYTHALSTKKTQKGRNYRLYLRPFYQKNHRKGATIACFGEKYYYLCKKQINHNYYDKQRINRKSL